jgi:ADP-heptose:LPS heptosyltransferase
LLALGDVLLILPVAKALARSSKVAFVDILTGSEFADDARRCPLVRHVFSYHARTGTIDPGALATTYDLVADLHARGVPLGMAAEQQLAQLRGRQRIGYASPHAPADGHHTLPTRRPTEHAVEYYTRAVSPLLDGPVGDGHILIGTAARRAAAARLPADPVCLAPGARYPWKRWPPQSYARLAARLAAHGMAPVIIGHPFDEPYVRAVTACCPVDVISIVADTGELAAMIAAAGIVVANNSGLTALASAAGARVVCLHSHTLPAMWRPWGTGHVNLTGNGADMPCGCSGAEPHDLAVPCGKGISVDDVSVAVLGLAAERSL